LDLPSPSALKFLESLRHIPSSVQLGNTNPDVDSDKGHFLAEIPASLNEHLPTEVLHPKNSPDSGQQPVNQGTNSSDSTSTSTSPGKSGSCPASTSNSSSQSKALTCTESIANCRFKAVAQYQVPAQTQEQQPPPHQVNLVGAQIPQEPLTCTSCSVPIEEGAYITHRSRFQIVMMTNSSNNYDGNTKGCEAGGATSLTQDNSIIVIS
jgi:hypothetical protein